MALAAWSPHRLRAWETTATDEPPTPDGARFAHLVHSLVIWSVVMFHAYLNTRSCCLLRRPPSTCPPGWRLGPPADAAPAPILAVGSVVGSVAA